MKQLLILIFVAVTSSISAQDSVSVLQYNLLNYGNYTGYCNTSNNNHIDKDEYLNTIISYLKPDIFTVNELSDVNYYHDRLLNEVLNSNGRKYYKRTPATNTAGSDIINMLFYDSTKVTLHSMKVIQSFVRDINLYRLYFNTSQLLSGDTIFLNCIVAHLKAGSNSSDEDSRGIMAANVINWLKQNAQRGNYLLMGDFNLYTASEEAYQTFTSVESGSFQFFDPVNAPGEWNNNIAFARYHTQSVVTSSSGCQASGGMDDRFDFILATDEIIEGSGKVRYKQGSYQAIGQDGNHFNQSIINLPNNSVPATILDALGRMSDHLPVRMVLEVEAELPGAIAENSSIKDAVLIRVSESEALINLTALKPTDASVRIFSCTGQLLKLSSQELKQGFNSLKIPIGSLDRGLYLINISQPDGYGMTLKLIK